jgi:hypothetical protein
MPWCLEKQSKASFTSARVNHILRGPNSLSQIGAWGLRFNSPKGGARPRIGASVRPRRAAVHAPWPPLGSPPPRGESGDPRAPPAGRGRPPLRSVTSPPKDSTEHQAKAPGS